MNKSIIDLMDVNNFKKVSELELPESSGLYAIRIIDAHALPKPFCNELKRRNNNNLLYVGIARKNLKNRLYYQELKHKKPGTFFRSIGAILGKRPIKGSLSLCKSTNKNYRFSKPEEELIKEWMNNNLIVNFISLSGGLNNIENQLIKEYKPIINLQNNPYKMKELCKLREDCLAIAREKCN